MELRNKKANFLGDSITEGVGTSCPEHIYLNRLKESAGLAQARNYGISGTRIARQRVPINPVWDKDFISRVDGMDADADIVTAFGGTNDYGHGDAPLGSFSDRAPDTFYGGCRLLMENLIDRFPLAVIVIITPLHRCNEDDPKGDGNIVKNIAPLSAYVEIIRKAARYYALPVLDLYAFGGIQPCVPVMRERYCPDGLHPNDMGHAIIASRLEGFLRTL